MDNLTERVMRLMDEGYPPSQIDKRLNLEPGRARKVVVRWWQEDKMDKSTPYWRDEFEY